MSTFIHVINAFNITHWNSILPQDTFLGEILGVVVLADDYASLNPTFAVKPIRVLAEGVESRDGQTLVDRKHGKLVKVLENLNPMAYYNMFADKLGDKKQSAVIGSFDEQSRIWRTKPTNQTENFNIEVLS